MSFRINVIDSNADSLHGGLGLTIERLEDLQDAVNDVIKVRTKELTVVDRIQIFSKVARTPEEFAYLCFNEGANDEYQATKVKFNNLKGHD